MLSKPEYPFDMEVSNTGCILTAGVAKLVDAPDLGSGAARRVGSSPITRTKKLKITNYQDFCGLYLFQSIISRLFIQGYALNP